MRNIWIRIGLGAVIIFAIGMIAKGIYTAGRDTVVGLVDGDGPIPIPLMGAVPFQIGDARLGDLRRVTLLRDAPHHISGVKIVARLGDSVTVAPLKDCTFITLDGMPRPQPGSGSPDLQLTKDTRFKCLADSTGLASFGTVEIRHTQGDEPTTLERTLIFPPEVIAEIQRAMGNGSEPVDVELGDSVQRTVEAQAGAAEAGGPAATPGSASVPAPVPARTAPAAPPATP